MIDNDRLSGVPYVFLMAQWSRERTALLPIIERVLQSGKYIGGQQVETFEGHAARLCQTKHCVALNSGTDALVCALVSLGVKRGDEVITPPNSFVASTAAIVHIGAKPVFVDVLPDQNIDPSRIEAAITSRTRAIMPVHLTGRMARMDQIKAIADRYEIPILEDAAQAIGSKYLGVPSGKWGRVGCFSTHPLKNLNGCGDGGFLVTDDDSIAREVRAMRTHGFMQHSDGSIDKYVIERFGYVSRMDALQAAILSFRTTELDWVIAQRQRNAELYTQLLDPGTVFVPKQVAGEFNSYHTFVIQIDHRDELREHLRKVNVETGIHYPIPIHLQPASRNLGFPKGSFPVTELQADRILTLPIHQFLTKDQVSMVGEQVNKFLKVARNILSSLTR